MHPITATTNTFLAPQTLSLIISPVPIFLPRIADCLGLPKDHPLRFGIDLGGEWDTILTCCTRRITRTRAKPGPSTSAQDRPMRNRLAGCGRYRAIKTSPRMARGH